MSVRDFLKNNVLSTKSFKCTDCKLNITDIVTLLVMERDKVKVRQRERMRLVKLD